MSSSTAHDGLTQMTIHAGAPAARLARSIERTRVLASFGLIAGRRVVAEDLRVSDLEEDAELITARGYDPSAKVTDEHLRLPDAPFDLRLFGAEGRQLSEIQDEFDVWLLARSLQECVGAVGRFLLDVRNLAEFVALLPSGDDRTALADMQARVSEGAGAFDRLTFTDKLDGLDRRYDIAAPPDAVAEVMSIIRARNCLEHRAGVVGREDCNDGDCLTVRWHRLRLMAGDQEVSVGSQLEGPVTVRMEPSAATHKTFALGTRIGITPAEFSDMCWTLSRFGPAFASRLDEFMLRSERQRRAEQPG